MIGCLSIVDEEVFCTRDAAGTTIQVLADAIEVIGDHGLAIRHVVQWNSRAALYSYRPEGRTLVMAGRDGDAIYGLAVSRGELNCVARIQRSEDSGFRWLRFIEHERDVLCVFENGIVCITEILLIRWKRFDLLPDEFPECVVDGKLYYHDNFDRRWWYDLMDGSEGGTRGV